TRFSRDWSSDVCSSDLLKHVIERIAFAEERNGLTNTPAQKFSARINGLFDDMTDEGKRNYVENYLYREELSELEGDAREARVQRSEERRVGKEGRSRGE